MSWLSDKASRRYFRFGVLFCLALMFFCLCCAWMQGICARDSMFQWEKAAVSSLVEQGVDRSVIVRAIGNENVTEEGEKILEMMGHTQENIPLLFSVAEQAVRSALPWFILAGTLFSLFFLSGMVFYMGRREEQLWQAVTVVEEYASGDFSRRLTPGGTGALAQLLGRVDRLATALQAKIESEWKEKEFLKNTMTDISHQLKTPLAALNMYTEIISSEPERPETVKKFAERSLVSLARMERLIYLLLKMMRLDAGNVVFAKRRIRVRELAELASEDLFTRAENEGKSLLFQGADEIRAECDPEWTAEALGNLIKNGLDHTEEGGTVRVSWRQSPGMLRICVEDDGKGIPGNEIHHIFKRFYRSSRSLDTQGIGLGLPLARSITEGQGGILTVRSSPGQGTVFAMSFPCSAEKEPLRRTKEERS